MSQQYSRKSKQTGQKEKRRPTEHIKYGLTAFQKTLALVGSILSIIVASITITNYLHSKGTTNEDKSPSSTIVIENNGGQGASNTRSGNTTDTENSSNSSSDYQSEVINPDSSSDTATNDTPASSIPATDTETSPTSQGDGTTDQPAIAQ
ncbi:DUF6556 family protein [Streptococcus pluranimalium]|uniref:Histone acetyltransferase Gcn5 n=1 Tax=Streptococcus pluranimalium TaxID=82348 RepID=A0A2L0D4F9_9STRE|nr:DUF6556 family protein [Streptococcus pluranimalium]AUW96695.1 hypothetical protein C0J00_06010 [Streptococcus pluranimalium]